MSPSRADVQAAARRIAGRILETPIVELAPVGREIRLLLKLENRQHCRCFKPRGALNAALRARESGPVPGLITFSSGNHGQAVALAARELGVSATVVAPEDARASKIEAMEARGARILRHGLTSQERMDRATEIAADEGLLLIPPYDHPDVIAGQGTIGLEIDAGIPGSLVVVVPVGGGGLSAGIALALAHRSDVRIVGVEPADADDARRSLATGRLASNDHASTSACDGLRNTRLGRLNWAILSERLENVVTVTDEEVSSAVDLIDAAGHGPVEPSGAAALAAVMAGGVAAARATIVVIVSGGNA